jgi:hypothetical protein
MTVLFMAASSPSASAQTDERPPPSLIERALRNDAPGGTVSERALAAAPWIPQLRLGAVVTHGAYASGSRFNTTVYGVLAWPLGRTPVGDNIAAARDRRARAAARDSLVERIAAAWHTRNLADDAADEVAARLADEEANATLDALSGAATEDEP